MDRRPRWTPESQGHTSSVSTLVAKPSDCTYSLAMVPMHTVTCWQNSPVSECKKKKEWRGWESVRMGGSDNKGDGVASQPRRYQVPGQPPPNRHQVGGCLPQPRWAVCATGAGAHQGQTSREGEKDIWWTAGTARGGTGHPGLTHTETERGRLWTTCGQRRVDSKNSQTTPATTSTTSIRQLLGAADVPTAHHATFSTAPTHQLLGSANAEMTPTRAQAATADRKQRPDATCEGKTG